MSLRVIGVGYPRTGSLSLKHALEQLGFGPCHHMAEVLAHPERWAEWIRAAQFADAKFILSLRPPDKWYESARSTVFSDQLLLPMLGTPMADMTQNVMFNRYEGGSVIAPT